MSHLAHIVKLKESLIKEGILHPQQHIDIAQTAYTKALITVCGANKLNEQTRINFNRFILSYWNEVTPVNGNMVLAQVGQFFRSLQQSLNSTLVDDVIVIKITPRVETEGEKDYTKLESYSALVQILIDEANRKLQKFTETSQIV